MLKINICELTGVTFVGKFETSVLIIISTIVKNREHDFVIFMHSAALRYVVIPIPFPPFSVIYYLCVWLLLLFIDTFILIYFLFYDPPRGRLFQMHKITAFSKTYWEEAMFRVSLRRILPMAGCLISF